MPQERRSRGAEAQEYPPRGDRGERGRGRVSDGSLNSNRRCLTHVDRLRRAVEWGESSSCHTISIASWDTVLVKATVRGCDRSSHVHGPGRQTGWRSRRNHHGPRARCRGVARGPPGERQGCGRRRRVAPGDHHRRRGQPPLLSPCHLDHERSECSAGRHDGTLRDRGALCRPILSHCRPAEGPPRFTIGSMASLMPGRSRGPRLGLP